MGKIKYLMMFVNCFISQFILSQQYEITYEVAYKATKSDTLKLKNFYVLKLDSEKRESIFTSLKYENSLNITIYKNFNRNEFTSYESILNNNYSINYNFNYSAWKLENIQKDILGYSCRKAIISFGGRDWEAWYTNDISLQDGPYKFYGLPGLILEIYSRDGDYNFTMKGLMKKNLTVSKPTAIPLNTIAKEKEFKLKIISDPASQYRNQMLQLKSNNMGISVSFNGKEITQKETEQRIINDFEKWRKEHDNPIEKDHIWIK